MKSFSCDFPMADGIIFRTKMETWKRGEAQGDKILGEGWLGEKLNDGGGGGQTVLLYLQTQIRFPIGSKLTNSLGRTKLTNSLGKQQLELSTRT